MKAVHATSHKGSTHNKRSASCKATQSSGPDKLVKKARNEHDGKQPAVIDFETGAHLGEPVLHVKPIHTRMRQVCVIVHELKKDQGQVATLRPRPWQLEQHRRKQEQFFG